MPLRRCLDCHVRCPGSRCRACTARHKVIRNADRPIARAVIAASPICACTGCGLHDGPCRSTDDLTAGHVIPLARGGTNDGPRRTECRRCNSSIGARL